MNAYDIYIQLVIAGWHKEEALMMARWVMTVEGTNSR